MRFERIAISWPRRLIREISIERLMLRFADSKRSGGWGL
jgi:hypothetical protein